MHALSTGHACRVRHFATLSVLPICTPCHTNGVIVSSSNLNALLSEFYKSVGFPVFVEHEDGYYCFTVDDSLLLELKFNPDSCILDFFLQLGFIHPDYKDEVIVEILDANVLWRGTGGVTLGQDSATGMVTLSFQENIEYMSYQRFAQILETVVSSAEYWADRIAGRSAAHTGFNSPEGGTAPDRQWVKS